METTRTIDAAGKTIGRVASEAAKALRGKMNPSFLPYKKPETKVYITNAKKLSISDRKMKEEVHPRYSGYPGGLRKPVLRNIVEKKGHRGVLVEAIYGMLPKNKLRKNMLKNLTITD